MCVCVCARMSVCACHGHPLFSHSIFSKLISSQPVFIEHLGNVFLRGTRARARLHRRLTQPALSHRPGSAEPTALASGIRGKSTENNTGLMIHPPPPLFFALRSNSLYLAACKAARAIAHRHAFCKITKTMEVRHMSFPKRKPCEELLLHIKCVKPSLNRGSQAC